MIHPALFSENPLVQEAYFSYLREDFDSSIRILEQLAKDSPAKGEFLNDLAVCLYLTGDRVRSRETLNRALHIVGTPSAPQVNLSYLFHSKRFPEPADHLGGREYHLPAGAPDFSRVLVSIILLEYNNPRLTLDCLRSIRAMAGEVPYEVILIDNSEAPPPLDYVRSSGIERLVYKKNEYNLGFAAGCNQGAALARGGYLYFLNNDTLFQKGCMEELASVLLLDEKVGIVGSKLLFEDGSVQHAGILFDIFTRNPKHRGQLHPGDDPFLNIPLKLQAVTAASLMIRRDLFDTLGGFSEAYRNGFEDVDLCLNVLSAGREIIYNPRSVLTHFESKSQGRFLKNQENIELFRKRWLDRVVVDEAEILSQKDLFLLCFTENPGKRRRQNQLFNLVRHLDRRHPETLDSVPLYLLEKLKHRRFQKSGTYLFDELMKTGKKAAAGDLYRYFRLRNPSRWEYIRHMRSVLSSG